MTQVHSVEKIIEAFVKLRDQKLKLERTHKEEMKPITEKMLLLEGWLQRDLMSRGVQSQKTGEGTAYLTELGKCSVKDRDALMTFAKANNMWELFENKVNKSVVEDYLENTGELVPGVSYTKTTVCRIRR